MVLPPDHPNVAFNHRQPTLVRQASDRVLRVGDVAARPPPPYPRGVQTHQRPLVRNHLPTWNATLRRARVRPHDAGAPDGTPRRGRPRDVAGVGDPAFRLPLGPRLKLLATGEPGSGGPSGRATFDCWLGFVEKRPGRLLCAPDARSRRNVWRRRELGVWPPTSISTLRSALRLRRGRLRLPPAPLVAIAVCTALDFLTPGSPNPLVSHRAQDSLDALVTISDCPLQAILSVRIGGLEQESRFLWPVRADPAPGR
jgi:hypothetical protein